MTGDEDCEEILSADNAASFSNFSRFGWRNRARTSRTERILRRDGTFSTSSNTLQCPRFRPLHRVEALDERFQNLRDCLKPCDQTRCCSTRHTVVLPWSGGSTHLQYAARIAWKLWRCQSLSQQLLRSKEERWGRTLQVHITSTKTRRTDRRISDFPQRTSKILWLWCIGGRNDSRPDHGKVPFQNTEAETTAAREPRSL